MKRTPDGAVDVGDEVVLALRRPFRKGGLGIRSLEATSPVAFYSASVQALPITRHLITSSTPSLEQDIEAERASKQPLPYRRQPRCLSGTRLLIPLRQLTPPLAQ